MTRVDHDSSSPHPAPGSPVKASRSQVVIAAGIAAMIILQAALGATAIAGARLAAAQDRARADQEVAYEPDPGAESDPIAEPSPAVSAPPDITVPSPTPNLEALLPESCDSLYSPAMRATLEGSGATLNPQWWLDAYDPGSRAGVIDSELQAILMTLPRIECAWVPWEIGSEWGLTTAVAVVTDEQASQVNARLAALGYNANAELGGDRYVLQEDATDYSLAYGESHIIREHLWFATSWVELGPSGYTADIVKQVFG